MFKATLKARPDTAVKATVDDLVSQARGQGVEAAALGQLEHEASRILSELVSQGQKIAALGSQMSVDRTVTGDDYRVQIQFRTNDRKSLFGRLWDSIRGR